MAIMFNTLYDRNFMNATANESLPINYTEFRAGAGTIVSSKVDIPSTFKVGDNVTIITPAKSFSGKISKIYPNKTAESSAYFYLEPGIDKINGPKINSGTFSHSVAAPVAAEAAAALAAAKTVAKPATTTSSKMKYLLIGVVVIGAGLLLWKYKAKIFKKK